MGVCNCSMFCCTLLYVHFSIAIILMGKRELIALLNLSSWCLVMVEWLFLTVPLGCLQFVIVVFPDHTHLLFLTLTGGSGLCPRARHFILCLILVKPRKAHPNMTEKIVDWKIKNQNKDYEHFLIYQNINSLKSHVFHTVEIL